MNESAKSSLADQFAAAIDWWRDAGVDHDWIDSPQSWTVPTVLKVAQIDDAQASAAAASTPPPAEPDRSEWPSKREDFAPWWLESEWLDSAARSNRVAPRGSAGAELMIMVPEPEPDDVEMLLSGPQGRLLDAMLAAWGVDAGAVYRASLLPRPIPHADWAALAARGLGELACHHIALAAPKRLIVFGSHILPLLGHNPAINPANSPQINHGSSNIPILAMRDLAVLLERPRWKGGAWQSLLEWTQGET